MKNLKFTRLTLIAIVIVSVTYAALPEYLRNSLFYQKPDTDDYKIFDNRIVQAGAWQPWDTASFYNDIKMTQRMETVFEESKTASFLVFRDRKLIYEKYGKAFSQESVFNGFSITKTIVGLLTGIAVDAGLINSVEDPVGSYLSVFDTEEWKDLRIVHLLEMSSGIPWKEKYRLPFSSFARVYYTRDLDAIIMGMEPGEKTGQNWQVNSLNTLILGSLLEKVTGRTLSYYASQKLWKPIGASADALWSIDQLNGKEKAFCCFHATARDFARLGQLFLNEGVWNGRRIVSASFIRNMTRASGNLTDESGNPVNYYGRNVWITRFEDKDVFYMEGLYGQYVFFIPEENMIIARFGKKKNTATASDTWFWLNAGFYLSKKNQ